MTRVEVSSQTAYTDRRYLVNGAHDGRLGIRSSVFVVFWRFRASTSQDLERREFDESFSL